MNRDTAPFSKDQKDRVITMVFCMVLLYITFSYVVLKVNAEGSHDFKSHVLTLLPLFRGSTWWKGWLSAPHCLWHLTTLIFFELLKWPADASAAAATCIYTLFYYLVLLWVLRKASARNGEPLSMLSCNCIATAFYFVQSLYVFWFDAGERYLGGFSMNPLHNPTQLCVRGFGVLAFCIVIDILGSLTSEQYVPVFFDVRSHMRRCRVLLALILFLSAVTKPTFAEVLIPAVAFYMLGVWLVKLIKKQAPGAYFKECLLMLVCAVPALLYILLQYILLFFLGGSYNDDGGMILTSAFAVWHLFTDNVMLSVLLGMAFPIYMFIIDPGYWVKSIMGRISLLAYGFGFLMASFLGEAGERMNHANFIWPYMSGMLLVWLTALLRMIALTVKTDNTRKQRILLNIGLALFLLHLLFGLIFLRQEMLNL